MSKNQGPASTSGYDGEVVISGISCRLPESDNMEEFRENLMNGVDMVTEDGRRWKPETVRHIWLPPRLSVIFSSCQNYRPRKMASCRDCPCDSASCRDSRQEAKSHGQSLQEARDRGQSRRKPNMTDSLCRKRQLADSFIPCVDQLKQSCQSKNGYKNLPTRNGKLKDISKFDAAFFGVHPKQANRMDAQLRILLEITYEAIVDAGVNPLTLRGSNTGVYIGAQLSETLTEIRDGDPYVLTGNSLSMFSNRLSYFFDFKGPSLTIETACSSGLYALNLALKSIRSGECDAAIVGGTNTCLHPAVSLNFLNLGVLSPGGKCRSFDKNGDGYVRSEGIVVLYLQKADDCKRIYCTVVHSKTNCDGNKPQGVTFPSSDVQKELLQETYKEAGVDPNDVAYVEAHATGTQVGDPAESTAITDVFCAERKDPLLIGSVKSNMGHCESGSGTASLAKVIIAMETNIIPANLHFSEPNENIPGLFNGKLEVIDKNKRWKGGYVGVNSFGFGGANAHVVLRSNSKEPRAVDRCKKPRLVMYGSRTQEGVESVLNMAQNHPHDINIHKLLQETCNMPVDTHPYRGFTVLNSGQKDVNVQKASTEERPVWFIFSGMGSQWSGMGKSMMEIEVFRTSIMRSDSILKQYGVNLFEMIVEGDDLSGDIVKSFVGITAIQVALVDMLTCMDIRPDGILGHSVGELGCAYADGSLTAEEAVLAAYWRGHCVQNAKLPPGGMAAVGLTMNQAFHQCPPGVVPACHNAFKSVTVSGPLDDVKSFVERLKEKDVFAKMVDSAGVAFHSYFMKDVAKSLKIALEKVIVPKPRTAKWISSSFPQSEWSTEEAQMSSAEYHVHNLVSPVMFCEALRHVPDNAVAIEISPHCLLQSILKETLSPKCCIVGIMKKNVPDNVSFSLTALGKCYQNGLNFDPLKLFPSVQLPVPRGTPMIAPCLKWDHSESWYVLREKIEDNQGSSFVIDLSKNSEYRYLLDHKVDGRSIFPAAVYYFFTWKALASREGKQWDQMPVMFEDIHMQRATMLSPDAKVQLEVKFIAGSDEFQVITGTDVVCTGKVTVPDNKTTKTYFNKDIDEPEVSEEDLVLDTAGLYTEIRLKGFEYGPSFQQILGSTIDGRQARVAWTGDWIKFMDAVTHTSILPSPDLFMPVRVGQLIIDPEEQATQIKNLHDISKGLPVFFDKECKLRRCAGMHLQDMTSQFGRRVDKKQAVHESFEFVPFSRSICMDSEDPALVNYAKECLKVSMRGAKRHAENGLVEIRSSSKELQTSNEKENERKEPQSQELFSDPKRHSFLSVLTEINELSNGLKTDKKVEEIVQSKAEDLESDFLLGYLQTPKYLRPCLDILLENTSLKTIKVVELYRHGMTKMVRNVLQSRPAVNVCSTIATLDTATVDSLLETETDLDILEWEPGSRVPDEVEQFDLVVADYVIRKHANIRHTLRCISEILAENGYILIHEVTTNFYARTKFDCIFTSDAHEDGDGNGHTQTIHIEVAKWRQIFAEEGFEVIYEVSDNILSSLFLIKKSSGNLVEQQTIVRVTDLNCEWVTELKKYFLELSEKPKGENLWLKAEGDISGVLGLVNCLRTEPGGDKLRCIFNMEGTSDDIDNETMDKLVKRDLIMNVRKDGQWGSYRHMPMTGVEPVPSKHAYVTCAKRGDLSSLKWYQSSLMHSQTSQSSEEVCHVHYASLNFRDVLVASGKLLIESIPGAGKMLDCLLGSEFSGITNEGKRIMGMVMDKGLATTVLYNKNFQWPVPDHWSLEEAATVPVVYTTVYYALVVRANIHSNNSVLIHSGTGGVGQAAIRVALSYGCKVFTTVGTDEKRSYLKEKFPQLDDSCIFSSRDTKFEVGIRKATAGKGVDIVLNSLAEEKLFASVRVLAKHGKFLEIGKVDLANNSALGMSIFLKNITFHGILLDSLFESDNGELEAVSRCFMEGIKSGVVKPLKATVFDSDDVEGAFRYMAQGKHIGKVVVKVRNDLESVLIPAYPKVWFNPEKTYIITGGLGGFGLELAFWMSERGAKNLVLTSRSGVTTGYQRRMLHRLKKEGAKVTVSKKNITKKEEVKELIKSVCTRPVGGVFHLAVVLRDAFLENQTQENFETVGEPKVTGTINLDHVTREFCSGSLDWFVAFSSTSSGYGNPGQSPYGFANSLMERVVEKRKAEGYPGLAIQWGPIGDVGIFISHVGDNDTVLNGTSPQRITSCLQSLDFFMTQSKPVVCSYVTAERKTSGSGKSNQGLVAAICNIIGLKDPKSIDENKTLGDLGLDSLLSVEIRLLLESDYSIFVQHKEVRDLTMKKLKGFEGEMTEKQRYQNGGAMENETLLSETQRVALKELEVVGVTQLFLKLNDVEEGIPLFVLHGLYGKVISQMVYLLAKLKVPVYYVQRHADVPTDSLEAMAAYYVQAIKDMCKNGPIHLAGFSLGSCIALESALQFQAIRYDVMSLTLLDGSPEFTRNHLIDVLLQDNPIKSYNTRTNSEMRTFNFELKNGVFTEEKPDEIARKIVSVIPGTTLDEARGRVIGTRKCRQHILTYAPGQKYSGDIQLIASAYGMTRSGDSTDYGLNKLCTGKVSVSVFPGDHHSFLEGTSGEQIASLLNEIVAA